MLCDLRAQGVEPPALAKRPNLPRPLQWWLEAFYDLSRGRQITMGGAGPIALSEMLAYMQIFAIDRLEDRARFVHFMGQLDSAYLAFQHKKQELANRQDKTP